MTVPLADMAAAVGLPRQHLDWRDDDEAVGAGRHARSQPKETNRGEEGMGETEERPDDTDQRLAVLPEAVRSEPSEGEAGGEGLGTEVGRSELPLRFLSKPEG